MPSLEGTYVARARFPTSQMAGHMPPVGRGSRARVSANETHRHTHTKTLIGRHNRGRGRRNTQQTQIPPYLPPACAVPGSSAQTSRIPPAKQNLFQLCSIPLWYVFRMVRHGCCYDRTAAAMTVVIIAPAPAPAPVPAPVPAPAPSVLTAVATVVIKI